MIFSELLQALAFYFTFSLFGLIGWPLAGRIFKTQAAAYQMSKLAGLAVFGYAVWLLASLKIISYQNNWLIGGLWLALLLFGLWQIKSKQALAKFNLKKFLKHPLVKLEAVLLLVYLAYLFLRTYSPAIYGTERFMDMMLFSSASKTDYFPFVDGWYAGHAVNYYYYGAYLMSLLAKLSRVSFLPLAYNFAFGLLFTQTIASAGVIIWDFTSKKSYAVLAAFLVAVSGTLFYAGCQLSAWGHNSSCSYASSTRLFTPSYIINEIPSYSFTVGDMHAHVLGLILFLFNLYLILRLLNENAPKNLIRLLLVVGLASSALTNAWDFMSLVTVLGLASLWQTAENFKAHKALGPKKYLSDLGQNILVVLGALVCMLPFLLNYQSPVLGLGFAPGFAAQNHLTNVQYPTPLSAELGMWGLLVFGCAVSWIKARARNRENQSAKILLIASILIILGVEIFFIPDIYSITNPDYFRANTVFKFGYHAWVMLSLAFCLFLYYARQPLKEKTKTFKTSAVRNLLNWTAAATVFAGLFYPLSAINQFYLSNVQTRAAQNASLDGSLFMKTESAGDYAAVDYINRTIKSRAVIVEAAGDSYTYFGRISAFTGNIAPIGWLTHEWTWRLDAKAAKTARPGITVETGYGPIAKISQDVQNIYQTADPQTALSLLQKYGAGYVYLGDLERKTYPNISLDKFLQIGQVVYNTNGVIIYKINGQ